MSKDVFEWNDELVKEMIYSKLPVPDHYIANVQKCLDEFKKSKEHKIEEPITVEVNSVWHNEDLTKDYTKGWYGYGFSINTSIHPQQYLAIKQAIEQVLNPSTSKVEEEKDWEILECYLNGSSHPYQRDKCLGADKSIPLCKIFKVKRKSDNTVFTIGDTVVDYWDRESKNFKGKIDSFEIKSMVYLMVKFSAPGHSSEQNIINIIHSPQPTSEKQESKVLFTTEDGVPIYLGQKFWWVCCDDSESYGWNARDMEAKEGIYPFHPVTKPFSTKEKAEEYILNNKPLLSVKDICALWCLDRQSVESLTEKAKQKL